MPALATSVFCCKFWNDLAGLKRLVESLKGEPCIFVDGRWKNYNRGEPLSTDGSREYLESKGYFVIDAPDLPEWNARNTYCEVAEAAGFDYCVVIDSDEYIVKFDRKQFDGELDGLDSYTHRQNYCDSYHNIYYRIHHSSARHIEKHQQIWIGNRQIFHPGTAMVSGLITAHDKKLRDPEEEKYKKEFYKTNPVR